MIAISALAGIMTFHSVKKTTNCSVLIIPQRNLSEDPSKMLTMILPVVIVLAAPFAVSIVEAMAAAVSGSNWRGN